VAAHIDWTPTSEGVLPMDTMTVAIDEMVPGDGSSALEVAPKVNTSTTGGADVITSVRVVAADGPTSSSGPVVGAPSSPAQVVVNDNAIEEPVREAEVILGHQPVGAPGNASLSDAMGTTHFALNQV
jgi:hypothetical protein